MVNSFTSNLRFRSAYSMSLLLILLLAMFFISGCDSDSAPKKSTWPLTASHPYGELPRWSPDGNSIVFGAYRDSRFEIMIWNIISGEVNPANEDIRAHNWDYQWSPDGTMIGFSAPGEVGDSLAGLWVINLAQGSLQRIYDRGRDFSWRSNSRSIVARIDQPLIGEAGIYEIHWNEEDTTATFLTPGFKPVCSPKLDYFAYCTGEIRGTLLVSGFSAGANYPVGGLGAVQWAWSGDGRTITAIINDYTPSGNVMGVMWRGIISENTVAADTIASWAAYPAPNVDGSTVAFLRTTGQYNANWVGIWVRTPDGKTDRIVNTGFNPAYSPNRDMIAYNHQNGGIAVISKK